MSATINPTALTMIEHALQPIMKSGRKIERIKLKVCPDSQIASEKIIQTRFGKIQIKPCNYVPKGVSYLIEDPWSKNGGFAWVSGYKNRRTDTK